MNTGALLLIDKASPSAHEQPEVSIQEESNGILLNQSRVQDENMSSLILTNSSDFPEFIEFMNEVDLVVRQPVKYKWKPTKCEHCQMFGYTLQNCRKRNKTRMLWREVAKGNATSSDAAHHQPLSPDLQEDFIKVLEKHIARSPKRTAAEEQALTQNHFQALIEQELIHNRVTQLSTQRTFYITMVYGHNTHDR
ncbi:hypothetical protein Cgig2_000519 [Carnegiea gigantea]|uniref:Uncharacterized protein n=1 Tax=Carnegiea gigantea TaxID=171969 RepID=A0A9Q1JKH1_9CARY|nr:hypothetical protein Cgig2_000519 [Carnegiea gigantea]